MKISNVLVISPPEYNHAQAFMDIAMAFSLSLQTLGHPAILTADPDECDGTTLVFGSHLIPQCNGTIEGDYILYQSEQIPAKGKSLFVDSPYIELLKRFPVWDYSQINIEALAKHGIKAKYVPIGYHKCLENVKKLQSVTFVGGGKNGKQRIDFADWSGAINMQEDIDVCFYGSLNSRRQKIIDDLKFVTIPVTLTDGTPSARSLVVANFVGYGAYRDRIIARSKIVLNMHYYDSALFEIFRIAPLLANKKAVVSERGIDKQLEEHYAEAVCFDDYTRLVDRVCDLLVDDNARKLLARSGYDKFVNTPQVEILRNVLES